jgi:hypothetical protein
MRLEPGYLAFFVQYQFCTLYPFKSYFVWLTSAVDVLEMILESERSTTIQSSFKLSKGSVAIKSRLSLAYHYLN